MNNKNFSLRAILIDKCLQNRRGTSVKEMLRAINDYFELRSIAPVRSTETIRNDITEIKNTYHVVVEDWPERRTVLYRYADAGFSITQSDLTIDDYRRMDQLLRQFNYAGSSFLYTLAEAIEHRQPLILTYSRYQEGNTCARVVYPYYLKSYRERWYLLAWNGRHDKVSTFALDRIIELQPAPAETFRPYTDFRPDDKTPEDYFRDIVGVSLPEGEQPVDVELLVEPATLPYLRSRPIHHSQQLISQDEHGARLRINVILNYELQQELLQYGEKVTVLAPATLRQAMAERFRKAMENLSAK